MTIITNVNIWYIRIIVPQNTHKLQHGQQTGNLTCRVFAIDVNDGSVKAVITINNATNCDWEDISVGIGQGGLWYIYVGDIGGNAGSSNQDISQMFSWYKLY